MSTINVKLQIMAVAALNVFGSSEVFPRNLLEKKISIVNEQDKNSEKVLLDGQWQFQKKIDLKQFQIYNLILNQSTLKDISPKIKIFRAGSDATSVRRACLIGKDGTILGFDSGPLQGESLVIDRIFFQRKSTGFANQKKCLQHKELKATSASIGGFSLEMKRSMIVDRLGRPSTETKNSFEYLYGFSEVRGETSVDITSFLIFNFEGEQLKNFEATYVESN